MPHKRYDEEAIKEAKDRMSYYKRMEEYAQSIKRKDKNSLNYGLEVIRDMELAARYSIFSLLKKGLDQADNMAKFNLGLMEAYQNVLVLFETPDQFFTRYDQEKEIDEKFLKEAEVKKKVEEPQD